MPRIMMLGAMMLLLFAPPARGQSDGEMEQLRRENDLLRKENELLKKEVELLTKSAAEKPSGSEDGANGATSVRKDTSSDDTEYTLVRCFRIPNTKKITFKFSAVNNVRDTVIGGPDVGGSLGAGGQPWEVALSARDGETLPARAIHDPNRQAIRLKKGAKRSFEVKVDGVDRDIAVLETVSLSYSTGGITRSDPVEFSNITIEGSEKEK